MIDQVLLYMLVSVALFCIGLHGLIVHGHLLRKILALNVIGAAVFLLLVTIARRNWDDGPDPVPHAMVLTGIVVAVSVTGFAVALLRRIYVETGRAYLPEERDEP